MTFTPKTVPWEVLVFRDDSGLGREGSSHEEIEVFGRANHLRAAAAETGKSVSEVCRKMGISENTFYRWKRKFFGMGVAELRRLKQLEEENRRLKQLVADSPSTRRCCRTCCEKNSEACPEA